MGEDFKSKIKKAISDALSEDIGSGDHTSLATIPAHHLGQARLLIKEDGILAGVEAAKEVARQVDKDLVFETLLKDGTAVNALDLKGTSIFGGKTIKRR